MTDAQWLLLVYRRDVTDVCMLLLCYGYCARLLWRLQEFGAAAVRV
jgi:hypothetical protein